jgi:UDP-N-acetylmuramyl pentapeptide phosphotransferase/UDP-N-acetylglucosamine-1-phosphate transferase
MILPTLVLSCLTGLLSFLAADAMRRQSARLGFTDLPNDRSLHTTSTPRAGGVGFALLAPVITAWGLFLVFGRVGGREATLLVSATGVALVGLADDRWSLPPSTRMLAQFVAAAAVVSAGVVIRDVVAPGGAVVRLGPLAIPVTLLWLVFLTNIYNFMDGIDGLAATEAIVAAAVMAALAACLGHQDVALAMCVLGGGVCGFLVLNRAPARVFMGDVGSTFLGFTFAGWAVLSSGGATRPLPFIAWIAVLSPYLLDATWTLLRRLWRRERIYQAHRTHVYQQLVQRGWTHGRTTALYGALAAVAGLLALLHFCFP